MYAPQAETLRTDQTRTDQTKIDSIKIDLTKPDSIIIEPRNIVSYYHLKMPKNNAPLLRSMYRCIIRGVTKIKDKKPLIQIDDTCDASLRREIEKALIDPKLYGQLLPQEIHFLAKEEFSRVTQSKAPISVYKRMNRASDLIEVLEGIDEKDSASWTRLIGILVNFRLDKLRESTWKERFAKNKTEIQQGLIKEMPSITARKRLSEMRRVNAIKKQVLFNYLSSGERSKKYKNEVEESKVAAGTVMKTHLKRLQKLGFIPNPFKLPYISTPSTFLLLNQPDQTHGIPGSGKSSILNQAYDDVIIRTIFEPELEYRLNEVHFVGKLESIVNSRGPAKIKIAVSYAGAMPVRYLRAPRMNHNFMKMLAMDIKRLMRCSRKQLIWSLSLQDNTTVTEAKHGEGYSVTGSGGYSLDEIMFPRKYYEKLAVDEAIWEYFVETDAMTHDNKPLSLVQTGELLNKNLKGWLEPLNIATSAIDQEMQLFFTKHRLIATELRLKREKVQKTADYHHQRLVSKYRKLLDLIEKNNVFLHSDLYNVNKSSQVSYQKALEADDKMPPKKKWGLPTREKFGATLGDYLVMVGFKGFRMGNKFSKRHNVIKKE